MGVGVSPMPPVGGDASGGDARVLVGLSMEPARQSRWSVLIRALLVLPLFVVVIVVGIAAFAVVVAAWFGALFTGRVPEGMQSFLTSTLRLNANVLAYGYFLVPRWPGVTFREGERDQLTLLIDHVPLSRWAVFFRVVLGYPANLVSSLLALGTYPTLFVMWLWGVIAGREPRALHQAMALVLRYQIRLQAYTYLLTPTQPFTGLLGDGVAATTQAGLGAVEGTARSTRWLITKASKAVVIVMLLLGVPVYLLSFYAERPLITKFQTTLARDVIIDPAYTTTVAAVHRFQAEVSTCAAPTYDGCAARAATKALQRLAPTSRSLQNNGLIPAHALADARTFERYFTDLEDELVTVQTSLSATVQRDVIQERVPTTLTNFVSAYRLVQADLTN